MPGHVLKFHALLHLDARAVQGPARMSDVLSTVHEKAAENQPQTQVPASYSNYLYVCEIHVTSVSVLPFVKLRKLQKCTYLTELL